jgi:N-methylhydantoinase A
MGESTIDFLGVDIGGTFTDFVLLRDGRLLIHKLLSTPDDPARALLAGMAQLGAPAALVHGTTVATNALLERRGARTALITTAGFGDVLAIGRGDRPSLYDLDVTRPVPLVPERWRLELAERTLYTGEVLEPLDPAELERLIDWLADEPLEAVAICLLHAYANPKHEQMVVEALERRTSADATKEPQSPSAARLSPHRLFISASHRVLPQQREYERASTTAVNAYVGPALDRYLGQLGAALAAQGVSSLRIMASDGGSMGLATARELPARATLSGPAGGVVGARFVAQSAGIERIITFDMGGTSTDVALCDAALPQTGESHVGGLPVALPSLDIHTVGAGGGSLARIDAGGALRVGPASAGADPGPACYGRGTQPTVTDANLLLGRLQPHHFLGGRMVLDIERARAAFQLLAQALFPESQPEAQRSATEVAAGTRLQPDHRPSRIEQAALGVVRVANAAMERAIRAVSVERGDDPRDYTLVAFGGAGPLHAAHLAEALGIRQVLVPRYPGVLSAHGMLVADVTRDSSQALLYPLDDLEATELNRRMIELADGALAALVADGEARQRCRVEFALDLRYRGQSYEISTALAQWGADLSAHHPLDASDITTAAAHFHALHERRYGHAMPSRSIEVVALRAKAISARPPLVAKNDEATAQRHGPLTPRASISAALAGDSAARAPASLYDRADLHTGDSFSGPAIVVQGDATTVIPADWRATVDPSLHLLLNQAA